MIKTLQLTQFGGYRSLELDLAPVTTIVGSNASGKSTLLHAVSVLMNGLDVASRVPPPDGFRRSVHGAPVTDIASAYGEWHELFTQSHNSSADHLILSASFEDTWISRVAVKVRSQGNTQPEVEVVVESTASMHPHPHLRPTKTPCPSAVLIAHVSALDRNEIYRSDTELEAASRSGARIGLIRNRLARLNEQAIERINRTLRTLTDAEIVSRTVLSDALAGSPLWVNFRRGGVIFEIISANHALVSMLALLSHVEMQLVSPTETGERVFLLDEPELHLHPRAHVGVAEHLFSSARAVGAQIILATHSADLVRHLWSHPDSAVFNIEREFTRVRRLHSHRDVLRALEQTRDLSSYSAINFLTSRRVLFVEGETDETIILRCALAYLRESPDRLARFEAWFRVSLDGVGNAPALQLIERLVCSRFLPRFERGEVLMVTSVLDRDYDKEPGQQISSGSQVERIDHVWSRHSIESLFIEVDILDSMLSTALGIAAPQNLASRIRDAIAAADKDENLRDGAEDEFADVLRRTGIHRRHKDAQVEARRRVRANPEIWQRGKDRAEFVLKYVRSGLPVQIRNKVRSSIAMVLEAIPLVELGRVKLPPEIVALLDELVSRGAV